MQNYLIKTVIAITAATVISSCSSTESTSAKPEIKKSSTSVVKTTSPKLTPKKYTPKKKTSSVSSYAKKIGKDKHGMPTYSDGSRTRYVRATAYSHKENEPGAPGRLNAAGTTLKYGSVRSAAADWSRLPLGTKFRVKGKSGVTYVVDDYGSALVGTNTVDFFYPSLSGMRSWGTRKVTIQIIQMGSFSRSAKLLKGRRHASHCRKMYYAIQKKLGSKYAKN